MLSLQEQNQVDSFNFLDDHTLVNIEEKTYTQKRRFPRFKTAITACISTKNSVITGTILDVGDGGVFFQPEVALLDGRYVKGSDCLPLLEEGNKFEIMMQSRSDTQIATKEIEIRWTGFSQWHECQGIGCMYIS